MSSPKALNLGGGGVVTMERHVIEDLLVGVLFLGCLKLEAVAL